MKMADMVSGLTAKEVCERCAGQVKIITCIEDPAVKELLPQYDASERGQFIVVKLSKWLAYL